MRGAAAVVEAISIIGPRNVSALARRTGLPIETVRYLLRKRLSRIGLRPQLYVDFKRLGLVSLLTELTFPPQLTGQAPRILNALAEHAYLTHYAEFADRPGYTTIFAPPVTKRTELEHVLQALVSQGLLASAEHQLLTWSRRVSVDPTYFDLRRGRWRINWRDLPNRPLVEPKLSIEPQADPHLDATDLLLLRELQKDATRQISEISHTVNLSRRVLQYHYQHHLSGLAVHYYIGWLGKVDDRSQTVRLYFHFPHLIDSHLQQVRSVFNRLPFLTWEGGNDMGLYISWADLPQNELLPSLNYVKAGLGPLACDMEMRIINWANCAGYILQHHLFDAESGWQFKAESLLAALRPLAPTLEKKGKGGGTS